MGKIARGLRISSARQLISGRTFSNVRLLGLMRRHALLLALLAFAAAARFTILFCSQTHVHSDEAIIGLMGKHILEGRHFPFFMYGQPYNAGAAWEAYLASAAFALFGVGVVPLKGCIVVLSLLCLLLFYRMGCALYDQRTAVFATLAFLLAPSLLKWHFQVRGYSWYFLSIALLTLLFASIRSRPAPGRITLLLFGIASGLSIWCLELILPVVAVLWLMLILRRSFSLSRAAVALTGFLLGYGPVIIFNFIHRFSNWRYIAFERPGGGFSVFFQLSNWRRIFLDEMPKFFGADTVLWYYPEKPAAGYVFYAIALLAAGVAIWPFLKSPGNLVRAIRGQLADVRQESDLDMLVLTAASFVPYASQAPGVPSYFLGGCFFLSMLTGRMLERGFSSSTRLRRIAAVCVLGAIVLTGTIVLIRVGRTNQIETLSVCENGKEYCMTRIASADIEAVHRDLKKRNVTSVWTTISFVYPLLFESGETLAVSNDIFEPPFRLYPKDVVWREPERNREAAFVVETDAPLRALVEVRCQEVFGSAPSALEYGKLTVITNR
jgi:4-amino-4-deoxy-L-arabinose transferase-like glycosyltransferase